MPRKAAGISERTFWDFWADLGTYLLYGEIPPPPLKDEDLIGLTSKHLKLKDFIKTKRLSRRKPK